MSVSSFKWESFYNEMAWKLLEHKPNRVKLVEIVKRVFEENSIPMPTMEKGELFDIDPFTVMGTFNRQITEDKRIKLVKSYKKYLGINADTPDSFLGLPHLNNQNATFYYFVGDRGENDIDDLWNLCEYALKYSKEQSDVNRESFVKYFDLCINKKGNANSKITMALFWINPSFYLNLDKRNTWYIYESKKLPESFVKTLPAIKSSVKINGNVYLSVVDKLHEFVKNNSTYPNFISLSHDAWVCANEVNEQIKNENIESKGNALADEDVEGVRYWLYSPGPGAAKWDLYHSQGIMAIGWGEMGDLTQYESKDDMRETMRTLYDPNVSHHHSGHATWQFVHEMKPGDIVFVKKGLYKIIGRGVVQSEYYFDDSVEDTFKNFRKVKWTHNGEWNHPGQAVLKVLTDITSYTDYVEKLNALFETEELLEDEVKVIDIPEYTKDMFLSEVYVKDEEYNTLKNLLLIKKNLILQGAPGVGKTFIAKRLAYSLIGSKDQSRVAMVQFHQSYSYEDFIEGFRPNENGSFTLRRGIFYNFCKKAEVDMEHNYYFIIDEINRGNLSKIFGELFMLIENDKRNNELPLLYSCDKFKVPANVHIIGLMNTADRSLAMMDYALRRRFAFYTVKPGFDSEGFTKYSETLNNEKFNDLIKLVKILNKEISNDDTLGEGFEIGHSYFCNIKGNVDDQIISNIIEFELIPLLKEYWFDEPSKVRDWSNKFRGIL